MDRVGLAGEFLEEIDERSSSRRLGTADIIGCLPSIFFLYRHDTGKKVWDKRKCNERYPDYENPKLCI